ncbi:MAG: signal peptidase II [Anaerolineales bacterium]|nr:signal peptidase II [Anaerolineales bacterium]
MSKARDYLELLGIAGVVVALDQLTKFLVRTHLQVGETWMPIPWLSKFVRVVHWSNTGAAFGLFPQAGFLFAIIAVVVSLAILYYFPRVPRRHVAVRFALALQLGGAIGNLIDRLIHDNRVTDLFSVGTFPVFNVADASVSIGVAILIAAMWVDERRARAEAVEGDQALEQEGKDSALELERSQE